MGRYSPPFAPLRASALSVSPVPSNSQGSPTIKRLKFKSSSKRRTPSSPDPWTKLNSPKFTSHFMELEAPMPWLWTCHKCGSRYRLGASRRCLHDGHYFCGGTTTDAITGETKQHKACGSEFDYIGWERYREVRPNHQQHQKEQQIPVQGVEIDLSGKVVKNDCVADCIYPSACHWNKHKDPEQRQQKETMKKKREHQQPSDPRPRMRRAQTFDTFLSPDRLANSSSPTPNPVPEPGDSNRDKHVPGSSKPVSTPTTTATFFLYRLARTAVEKTAMQLNTRFLTSSSSNDDDDDDSTDVSHGSRDSTVCMEKASPLRSHPLPSRRSLPATSSTTTTNNSSPPGIAIKFKLPIFTLHHDNADEDMENAMVADPDTSALSPLSHTFATGASSPSFPSGESHDDDDDDDDDDDGMSMKDSCPSASSELSTGSGDKEGGDPRNPAPYWTPAPYIQLVCHQHDERPGRSLSV